MKFRKSKRPIDYLPGKPSTAIYESWKWESLDNLREQMDMWFYAALCSRHGAYDDPKEREMFILFYSNFITFIEATYFYNKARDIEQKKRYENASDELKKDMDSENLPVNLTEEQILNPAITMEAFCKKFSIVYIRIELWDWMEAVNYYKGEFEIIKEFVSTQYLTLLTLCEAAYVITETK